MERKSQDGCYTFIGITPPHEIPLEQFERGQSKPEPVKRYRLMMRRDEEATRLEIHPDGEWVLFADLSAALKPDTGEKP